GARQRAGGAARRRGAARGVARRARPRDAHGVRGDPAALRGRRPGRPARRPRVDACPHSVAHRRRRAVSVGAGMLTVAQAQQRILESITPLRTERVALSEALGRVLAETVVSRRALPPFDNSGMDGYAVRHHDTRGASVESPVVLDVAGESRAGMAPGRRLRSGTAMRIMTGAPVPEGADAVVRYEDTDSGRERVRIQVEVRSGTNIRRAGEDMNPGDAILDAGRRLRPADLAACAALGNAWLEVRRRPRVA